MILIPLPHKRQSTSYTSALTVTPSPSNFFNGESFIKDATIASGAIHGAAIETPHPVTNIYNISLGIRSDEPVRNKVAISTNEISIHANVEEVLRNALAANEEVERLRDAMKNAASEGVQQALAAVERDFRSNGKLRRLLGI
ncbi:hypothetical protein [Citrobacter cronae]|uniref:hypothetical protein n=1 Tax=Citrobacter cronae TaxID=1748967 RepID=UPI00388FEEE6